MTDKERKKLTEAFGFPSPDKKEEFIEEFRRLSDKDEKKKIFPIVMKLCAAAAMIALMVGVLAHIPKNRHDIGMSDTDLAVNAVTSTTTGKSEGMNITTTVTSAVSGNRTSGTTASTTSSAVTGSPSGTSVSTTVSAPVRSSVTTRHTTVTAKQNTAAATTSARKDESITTTTTLRKETDMPTASYRDLTIKPAVTYTIQGNVISAYPAGNGAVPTPDNGYEPPEAADPVIEPNDQKLAVMFDNSYAVVLAKIDEIVYTSIDERSVTAENITVSRSLKGEFDTDDKLTLCFNGGYMSGEEYAKYNDMSWLGQDPSTYTVFDPGDCYGTQNKGETLLFFIKTNNGSMPDGSFMTYGRGDIGVFRLRGNSYYSLGDPETIVSESKLNSLG